MRAVRYHGRGGQGAKTANRILGTAAYLEGFVAQDSPIYGADASLIQDGAARVSLDNPRSDWTSKRPSGGRMSETGTISGLFQHDHDRLDALFQSFQTWKRQDVLRARQAFTQVKSGLERHIRWEEDFLFPLWEDKTGMSDGGPTFVMRRIHRQIEAQLQSIGRNLTEQNTDNNEAEQALLTVLGAHNLKEERVLYPAIDQVTTPEECSDILGKIRELPEARVESSAG